MMRKTLWVLLLVGSLLLAGCGPAVQPAAAPETPGGEVFMLALPRIEITFDEVGDPSILGLSLTQVGTWTGQDLSYLSYLRLPKFYVDWMTAANVQHIELRAIGDGIALFVNGKPMPHLAWDEASLQAAADFAGLFNMSSDMLKKFVPFVRRLGLDVALRFPLQPGASPIPLAGMDTAMLAAKPEEAPSVTKIAFEIRYNERGSPAILGVSTEDLLAMGISLPANLYEGSLRTLQAQNVQHMELRSKGDGLYIYVNGKPLPNIVWDNTFLTNAAELYTQMNPGSPFIQVVQQFVPMVDNADIAIMVHFPLAAGATPIPAQMH
jgi:hypothetical protein